MNSKKRLVVYTLTASILFSGCSLKREKSYDNALVEPVILTQQLETHMDDSVILESHLKGPSTEQQKEEIIKYVALLEGDNQIIIYDSKSSLTESMEKDKNKKLHEQREQDQIYSETIFEETLKQNPMIQIYYCGTKETEEQEKTIALLYPNVTYVAEDEKVEDKIERFYKANKVCGYCILKFREGQRKIENFDLEETVDFIKQKFHDINKQDVLDGITEFLEYIENTELFKQCEQVSNNVSEKLKPYVEKAIPKIESSWEKAKPYIDRGIEQMENFYEEVKPDLQNTYEKAKQKVKSIFGN